MTVRGQASGLSVARPLRFCLRLVRRRYLHGLRCSVVREHVRAGDAGGIRLPASAAVGCMAAVRPGRATGGRASRRWWRAASATSSMRHAFGLKAPGGRLRTIERTRSEVERARALIRAEMVRIEEWLRGIKEGGAETKS